MHHTVTFLVCATRDVAPSFSSLSTNHPLTSNPFPTIVMAEDPISSSLPLLSPIQMEGDCKGEEVHLPGRRWLLNLLYVGLQFNDQTSLTLDVVDSDVIWLLSSFAYRGRLLCSARAPPPQFRIASSVATQRVSLLLPSATSGVSNLAKTGQDIHSSVCVPDIYFNRGPLFAGSGTLLPATRQSSYRRIR